MKQLLRSIAVGVCLVLGLSAAAQDVTPTVTLKWINQALIGSLTDNVVRSGNAYGGKIYYSQGGTIKTVDQDGTVETFISGVGANKGMFIDDAGNILIANTFNATATTWMNFTLVNGKTKEVSKLTITKPTGDTDWTGGRCDVAGRAIGDFFSEEGGLCFLGANTMSYPIPIKIAKGKQVTLAKSTAARHSSPAQTLPYAQPSVESMAEVTAANIQDCFYFRPSHGAPVVPMYVGADGKAVYINQPKPSGKTSNGYGFDVFTLGGKKYVVYPTPSAALGSDISIADFNGKILFTSSYKSPYDNATNQGGNIIARKVDKYTVQLYQIYTSLVAGKGFGAMYEITIPRPEYPKNLYILGDVTNNGWNDQNPDEFTSLGEGKFEYVTKAHAGGNFKISTAKGSWDDIDNNCWWPGNNSIVTPGNTYAIEQGNHAGRNINIREAADTYTITVDFETKTMTVNGASVAWQAPDMYIRGEFNNWAYDMMDKGTVDADGNITYSYSRGQVGGAFLLTTDTETSTKYCGGKWLLGAGEHTLGLDGNNADLPWVNNATITATLNRDDLSSVKMTLDFDWNADDLYLRGANVDNHEIWNDDSYKFRRTDNADGSVTYAKFVSSMTGDFAVSTQDWNKKYCSNANVDKDGTFDLYLGGDNAKMYGIKDAFLSFTMSKANVRNISLSVASSKGTAALKPYAYKAVLTDNGEGSYTIAYKATAAAQSAEIELRDAAGNVQTIALPAANAGDNTASFTVDAVPAGTYTWALRLGSTLDGAKAQLAYTAPEAWVKTNGQRGGPVVIRDTKSDAYGYTVFGLGYQQGYVVYDRQGKMLYDGPILSEFMKNNFANTNSSTMRGDSRGDYAVFANWNDTAAGAWCVDPLDPETEPFNIFASPGATMASSGLWSLNGTKIGGGLTSVAFQGYGENQRMWTFDEDYAKNVVNVYEIGEDQYATAAPAFTISGGFDSGEVIINTFSKGAFLTQRRASATDVTPPMMYVDNAGKKVWNSSASGIFAGCARGGAISADESMFAIANFDNSVSVYTFTFDADGKPVFSKILDIPARTGGLGGTTTTELKFDAANNLHLYSPNTGGYCVYVLPGLTKSYYDSREQIVVPEKHEVPEALYIHYRHAGSWRFDDAYALERDGDTFSSPCLYIGHIVERHGDWSVKTAEAVDFVFTTAGTVKAEDTEATVRRAVAADQSFESMLGSEHYVYHPAEDGETLTRSTTADYDAAGHALVHSPEPGLYAVSVDFSDPAKPVLYMSESTQTGVENVAVSNGDATYYDVYGRRATEDTRGVVIRQLNGNTSKQLK